MKVHKDDLLMVDSGCDIPYEYYKNNKVGVLPLLLKDERSQLVDTRKESKLINKYDNGFFDINKKMKSSSPEINILKGCILNYLKQQVSIGKNPKSLHLQQANSNKIPEYKLNLLKIQQEFMNPKSQFHQDVIKIIGSSMFSIRLYDTKQVFSGQGLVALETLKLLESQTSMKDVTKNINYLMPKVETYAIPNNISYITKRTREKGDSAINRFQELILKITGVLPIVRMKNGKTNIYSKQRLQSNALNFIIQDIKEKFRKKDEKRYSSYICISYGGDIKCFKKIFKKELSVLDRFAMKNDFKVVFSVASSCAGINVGPKSVFVSYAI